MIKPSRHDHYPRHDIKRRRAMASAARALSADWAQQDQAPGGMVHAMQQWQAHGQPGGADGLFDAMMRWMSDLGWLHERIEAMITLSRRDDFAQPPVRQFAKGQLGGLAIAECGAITLSLMLHSHGDHPPAPTTSAVFTAGHGLVRVVRAGGASADHYRVALSDAERAGIFLASAAAPCRFAGRQMLTDTSLLRVDQSCESFNLVGASGDIVLLQLYVHSPSLLPMREYDIASGRLVRAAAPDRGSSFRLMNLALLRALGRRDAAPVFAAAAAQGDFSARWQAMRELIALDTAAALPHLAAMAADDPHPEVRRAAASALDMIHSRMAASRPDQPAQPVPAGA